MINRDGLEELSKTMTLEDLSNHYGVHGVTVSRWLKKAKLTSVPVVWGLGVHDAKVREMAAAGADTHVIAAEFNLTPARVRKYCISNNIAFASKKAVRKKLSDKDGIIRKLAEEGVHSEDIAKQIGYSSRRVKSYMLDHKIIEKYSEPRNAGRISLRNRSAELRVLAQEGKTLEELSEIFDFTRGYVRRICHDEGIEVKSAHINSFRSPVTLESVPEWKDFEGEISPDSRVVDYFRQWTFEHKVGTLRDVSIQAYKAAHAFLYTYLQDMPIKFLTRGVYQKMMTKHGKAYHITTVRDYHNVLKASLKDAVYEGLLEKDPSYKITIAGRANGRSKSKFISEFELSEVLKVLDYGSDLSNTDTLYSWFIYLSAKTGFRFSETLGLTVSDFNFGSEEITINKTWNYKDPKGRFDLTKNKSSNRTISVDAQTMAVFKTLTRDLQTDLPIWLSYRARILNGSVNNYLAKKCKQAKVPAISTHSLRHTHASVLLAKGVSMASISARLGHADISTTQDIYTHITKELERKDDKIMKDALGGL